MNETPSIIIISGERDTGKTSFVETLYQGLNGMSCQVAGICEIKTDDLNGYFIKNLSDGQKFKWAEKISGKCKEIPYKFYSENVEKISELLKNSINDSPGEFILIFDEFGRLELRGEGLLPVFSRFILNAKVSVVVVQKVILKEFIFRYSSCFGEIINIELTTEDIKRPDDKLREIHAAIGVSE